MSSSRSGHDKSTTSATSRRGKRISVWDGIDTESAAAKRQRHDLSSDTSSPVSGATPAPLHTIASSAPPPASVNLLDLPTEVLLAIIRYLRNDCYANFALPFVCKAFRTIMHVPREKDFDAMHLSREDFERLQARNDEEWRERCKSCFADAKFYLRHDWEETYRHYLKRSCMRCGMGFGEDLEPRLFGKLWAAVPDWSACCRQCRFGPVFGIIDVSTALRSLDPEDFAHLPSVRMRNDGVQYGKKTLYFHLGSILEIKRAKREPLLEDIISQYTGNRDELRAAISYVDDPLKPASPRLSDLVDRLFRALVPRKSLFSDITRHHSRLLKLTWPVAAALSLHDVTIETASPSLDDYPEDMEPGSPNPLIWRDALAAKYRSVEDYAAAVKKKQYMMNYHARSRMY